ncbi:MAG: hypothetical protein EYC70_01235 [Planctomycetota bacterium]|nr:MAG: hypothetical protein EYC70_01235 [Planctomycetota bacterium]
MLCRPYLAQEGDASVSVFFRDTALSDDIGFRYAAYADQEGAAEEFVRTVKERFAQRLSQDEDHLLTVILDGENAWGSYREDGRPFLHALYSRLERDPEILTVTFSEYLDGDAARGVQSHPATSQTRVHDLFTGSWIDEGGSAPGADLGTWIGEKEENRAWELLGLARDALTESRVEPVAAARAYRAVQTAEGSDWFWWYGDDQSSDREDEFDRLFLLNLRQVFVELGRDAPTVLEEPIPRRAVVWTFSRQIERVSSGAALIVQTNCPGVLSWRLDDGEPRSAALAPTGGVMAGTARYEVRLGPFPEGARRLGFRFRCTHDSCDCRADCCRTDEYEVRIT